MELRNALGWTLFQQGKSQEAVVALEKAVQVDPKHGKSHNNLALASIDVGELEIAEAHYRESLALKEQPAIYNDLGFVLERQGLLDEAAAAYEKSIKLEPGSASAQYNLGAMLARSGKFAEAERHLRAAIKADPTQAAAHRALAQVLEKLGRTDEARRETESAQSLDRAAGRSCAPKISSARGSRPGRSSRWNRSRQDTTPLPATPCRRRR